MNLTCPLCKVNFNSLTDAFLTDYINHTCQAPTGNVSYSVPSMPMEESTELIKAYRFYSVDKCNKLDLLAMEVRSESVLVGKYGAKWPDKDMFYQCRDGYYSLTSLFECHDAGHSCGIYAYKNNFFAREAISVVAEVLMGGQVVEHERGYTASYCVMVSLEFNEEHSEELCKRYADQGVTVVCKADTHVKWADKLPTQHLYFGSWVRENYTALHNPSHRVQITDPDIAVHVDNFFSDVEYYSKRQPNPHYLEGGNRISWGPVQLSHGNGSVTELSHLYGAALVQDIAVVRDYDEFIEAYAAHLDITANALMMRDGKLVETVPGAEADVRNRIIRPVDEASAFRPDRLRKIRRMLWNGWTLAEGVELPDEEPKPKHTEHVLISDEQGIIFNPNNNAVGHSIFNKLRTLMKPQ